MAADHRADATDAAFVWAGERARITRSDQTGPGLAAERSRLGDLAGRPV